MLEAKATALTADAGDDAATMTVRVYDDATPAVVIWEGPVVVQVDAAPEKTSAQLDLLLERVERRQARIADLQALVGRPRRRR